MTKNPEHKVLYGAILVGYVALFTIAAIVEWAWPKKACDCQDQWKDGV